MTYESGGLHKHYISLTLEEGLLVPIGPWFLSSCSLSFCSDQGQRWGFSEDLDRNLYQESQMRVCQWFSPGPTLNTNRRVYRRSGKLPPAPPQPNAGTFPMAPALPSLCLSRAIVCELVRLSQIQSSGGGVASELSPCPQRGCAVPCRYLWALVLCQSCFFHIIKLTTEMPDKSSKTPSFITS